MKTPHATPDASGERPVGYLVDITTTRLGLAPDRELRLEIEEAIHAVNARIGMIRHTFRQSLRRAAD